MKHKDEKISLIKSLTFEEFKEKYEAHTDKINFKANLKSYEYSGSALTYIVLTLSVITLFLKSIIDKIMISYIEGNNEIKNINEIKNSVLDKIASQELKLNISNIFDEKIKVLKHSLAPTWIVVIIVCAALLMIFVIGKNMIEFQNAKRLLYFIEEIEKEEKEKLKEKEIYYLKENYEKNIEILNKEIAKNEILKEELK